MTYFGSVGFIIIPIATSISAWFNSIFLFIFLKKNNLFEFNSIFLVKFFRILISAIIMGLFLYYIVNFFESSLIYGENFKAVYMVGIIYLIYRLYL